MRSLAVGYPVERRSRRRGNRGEQHALGAFLRSPPALSAPAASSSTRGEKGEEGRKTDTHAHVDHRSSHTLSLSLSRF